eukprot:TRINITY_DN2288_c0_g2_i5.p1 TRINITY_DN2288_c0_g2~~TRINITY_DN2288_c0_g2_i5.p1  ORF type:complete len:344 (+),score=86.23 TRINITY_DN2288_c0_g2_i5:1-1032(+)
MNLFPRPHHLVLESSGVYLVQDLLTIAIESADQEFIASRVRSLFDIKIITQSNEKADVRLKTGSVEHQQGYHLKIDGNGVEITASTNAGLFYGISTLKQIFILKKEENKAQLPYLKIEDHPSVISRGIMLDVSRDKVPKMETLLDLVDRFADWKINELQLYMEHTFAYKGHEIVWKDASPFTAEEIQQLDAYCKDRFIELVPNQNSLGHLYRWLVHEPYRNFSEIPEGFMHGFSQVPEPYSLAPTDDRSLKFLSELYDQLLPNFKNTKKFNIGFDETFDVGKGKSKEESEKKGGSQYVYLEFLRKVNQLVKDRGFRSQYWGDIVVEYPGIFKELPEDGTCLIW